MICTSKHEKLSNEDQQMKVDILGLQTDEM